MLAALDAGFEVIDATFGGLGGCPFAPGATGNVATEEVVWTLERMGFATNIALEQLLDASVEGARYLEHRRPAGSAPRCVVHQLVENPHHDRDIE